MSKASSAAYREVSFDFSHVGLYNPVYLPLFYNRTRFVHMYGSAGSGKSRFGCQREIVLSFDSERQGKRTLVVRRYQNTLAASVYAELKGIIYEWNIEKYFDILKSPLTIINKITRVEFLFRGLDDVEKIKSVSGVDRVLIEEATEVDQKSDLDQLNLRLRGVRNGQITLMYNPVNSQHWLNTEIHQQLPQYHYILKTTYKDNLRLDQFEKANGVSPTNAEIIESFRLTNANYYKVYGLGEWGSNPEGLIYPDYEVVPSMPAPQFYGLDFGFNDPCALIAGAIVDAEKSKKDYFIKEILYERKLTSNGLTAALQSLGIPKNIPIVADCSRPEMIAALRRAGYWVLDSVKGAGSVKAGIDHVKTFDLKIVAGSKNLLKETSNYSWKNKNGQWLEEPQDGLDHCCDAFRYGPQAKQNTFSSTTWKG